MSDGVNEYVTTDTMFTFGGLAPNTQYNLTVRALCPVYADTSEAVSATATTECSYLASLPFYRWEAITLKQVETTGEPGLIQVPDHLAINLCLK